MTHLARFEQSTWTEDRDAMRNGVRLRMIEAQSRIRIALSDIEEAAWAEVVSEDHRWLVEADAEHAEARADALAALAGSIAA